MKTVLRTVALSLVLASAAHAAIPPERDNHCPPAPESGWIHCDAVCRYVNACVAEDNLPVGTYCWEAKLTTGEMGSCHDGDYDPCCEPDYQW